jgi:hypothetical protein
MYQHIPPTSHLNRVHIGDRVSVGFPAHFQP